MKRDQHQDHLASWLRRESATSGEEVAEGLINMGEREMVVRFLEAAAIEVRDPYWRAVQAVDEFLAGTQESPPKPEDARVA